MSDLQQADIDTVASSVQLAPATIASSAVIAPTTFLSFISGSVPLATITPPVSGAHLLAFVFTSASPGVTATTGNIAIATTTVLSKMLLMAWSPTTNKYYPSY
jgi:hypothetical protein